MSCLWSDCSSCLSHPLPKNWERERERGREGGREGGRESYNADRQVCCMRRKRACNAQEGGREGAREGGREGVL